MAVARAKRVVPGFAPTLAYTVGYLCLLVLVPLFALPAKTATLDWSSFWNIVTDPRVVASYRLSLTTSLMAAAFNAVFGLLTAWVLVRYSFPGRRILDALIDLPFALPTAVAGITLTTLYAPNGWLGKPLDAYGIKIAFTPLGITVALMFIGLPFVVRTLQPVIEDLDIELEEAAASLGAERGQVILRVILPYLVPAWLTGFALAFARGVGEYGSVVFISGNMPMRTEISPLLIVTKLEQYDYAGATAIAVVMLTISFVLLLAINALQGWTSRRLARLNDAVMLLVTTSTRAAVRRTPRHRATLRTGRPDCDRGRIPGSLPPGSSRRRLCRRIGPRRRGLLCSHPGAGRPRRAQAHPARGGDRGAVERRVRRLRRVGDRKVPISRQAVPADPDRLAVCRIAGDRRHGLRAALRASGILRTIDRAEQLSHRVRRTGHCPGDDVRDRAVRRPRNHSGDGGSRHGRGRSGTRAGGERTADFLSRHAAQHQVGPVYGIILCNARAMGEFGAVSVVSGHIRGLTNTLPLHVEILYNEYNFQGAFAVASVLTALALVTLVLKAIVGGRVRHTSGPIAEAPMVPHGH